jgi:uncharacterized protein (DUF433 family)
MKGAIHDRVRGPEIKGSRITVYDVLDYRGTHTTEWIANMWDLSVEQIEAAYAYIDAHNTEVMAEYAKMLAREKQGNSPEVRAILAKSGKRVRAIKADLKHRRTESVHA